MDDLAAPVVAGSKLDAAAGVGELRPGQALKASQQAARQSSSTGLHAAGQELIPPAFPAGSGFGPQPSDPAAGANGSIPLNGPLVQLSSVPLGHNGILLGAQPHTATSLADAALKQSARQGFAQMSGMVPVGVPASQPVQAFLPALVPVAGPAVQATAPGSVVEEQTRVLEALLDHISRTDNDRFFEAPVREEEAPGYTSIIKRPMCFQVMRQKVRQREYRTWHSFVEDFELIANNAMTYNQKRSRVHKAAITMLRAGKKHLQALELQGRKGISLLHPGGPQAAAADEAAERTQHHQHQQQQQQLAQPALLSPVATPSGPAMLSAQPRLSSGTHPRVPNVATHTALQSHASAGGSGQLRDAPSLQDPFDHLLPIDCQSEDEAGFSSFSDTDWESEAAMSCQPQQARGSQASVAGSIPLVPSDMMAMPSGAEVLAKAPQLKPAVTAQPWEDLLGSASSQVKGVRCQSKPMPAAQQLLEGHKDDQTAPGSHACFPESLDIIAAAAAAVGWPPAVRPFGPLQNQHPSASLGAPTVSSRPLVPAGPSPEVEPLVSSNLRSEAAATDAGGPTEGEPEDGDGNSDDGPVSSDSEDAPDHAKDASVPGRPKVCKDDPKAIKLKKPGHVRQLEWQARWLQLRLKELHWQQHRASQQLAALEASQQNPADSASIHSRVPGVPQPAAHLQPDLPHSEADAPVPSGVMSQSMAAPATSSHVPESVPAVNVPGQQPVTLEGMVGPPAHELAPPQGPSPAVSHSQGLASAAADDPLTSTAAPHSHRAAGLSSVGKTRQGSVDKRSGRSKARRRRVPMQSMRALHSHPFFAARGGDSPAGAAAAMGRSRDWAELRNEAAVERLDDEERLLLPACVHWGLEQLGKHVTASKRLLLQTQAPQGRGTAAPSKAPRKARGQLGLPPRPRMTAGGVPPSKAHLQRRPSKLGKRKPDWDASDFVHPAGLTSGTYVERPQVQDIRTPSVRLIGREQLQERQASIRTIHSQKRLATGVHRPGKAPAESGSSSEDTSDEVYAMRHTKKEEEERTKYLTWAGGAQKRNPKVPNPAPTAKPANIKLYRGDSGLTGPVVEHLKHPVQPARPLSPFLESLQPDLDQSQLQQPVALQNAPSQPAQHQTSPHVQQSLSQAAPQQPSHLQPTHLVAPPTVGAPPSPPKPAVEIPASLGSPGLVSISPTKVPAMGAPHPRSILPAALSSLGEWLNGKEGVSRGPRATDQQPPAPAVVNLQHAAADVVPALAPAAFSQPLPAVTADQRSPRPSPTASPLRGPSSSSAPPSGSGSPSGHAQAQSFPQPFWTTPHATQPLQAQAPIVVEDSTDKEAAGISSDATPAVSNGPAEETSPPTRKEEDGGSGRPRSTRSSSQKAAEAAAAAGLQLRSRSRTPAQSTGHAPKGRGRGRPSKASLSPSDQAPQSAGPTIAPKATAKERGRRSSAPAGDVTAAPARRARKSTRNR